MRAAGKHGVGGLVADLFTGATGEAWAIGRVAACPMLISALVLPFVALFRGQMPDFAALGVYFGGVGAAFMAMVQGTNGSEPRPPPTKDAAP
ncbi:MAG: hypothetical protein JWM33_3750 [Caulobacteraceae bacterium]|nr:hypothetical protein [Caulobacteraceae bacterium]